MGWQQHVNEVLRRTIRYELNRPAGHPARRLWPAEPRRMLHAPIFFFPAAPGSARLRLILGRHSRVYAPPDLPLDHPSVRAQTIWIQTSMKELEFNEEFLDQMLWDRVLGSLLARSGKPTIAVQAPPASSVAGQQIADCWPDARFVCLPDPASATTAASAPRPMTSLTGAGQPVATCTIRPEELDSQLETVIRRLCRFLRLPFEPAMLE